MIEQIFDNRPENSSGGSFFAFLPGFSGGGRSLSALRQIEDLYVPSSISTRQAMKTGERSLTDHHNNLAREIIDLSQGKDIAMFVHSMGGFEAIDVVKALLNCSEAKGRNIRLIFIATPGFTEKGFKSIKSFFRRFLDMNKNVTFYEQHVAYPLPENYYPAVSTNQSDLEIVFRDDSNKRTERRQRFVESLERTIPDAFIREKTLKDLQAIDQEMAKSDLSEVEFNELMNKRVKLLHPFIQSLFRGEQIDRQTHQKFLKTYKELTQDLSNLSTNVFSALCYLGRMTGRMYQGIQRPLAEVVKLAKKKDVNLRFGLSVLEKDTIVRKEDLPAIQKGIDLNNLSDSLDGLFFLEQLSHSSLAYYPDPLKELMQRAS